MLSIAVGSTIKYIYADFDTLLSYYYVSPASLLIAVGVIIFFVAAFGSVGAARESAFLINMFSLCLFVVFILQISAAFTAFAMQTTILKHIKTNLYDAINNDYNNPNSSIAGTIDAIQSGVGCCGVCGPEDWNQTLVQPQWNSFLGLDDIIVPDSCCGDDVTANIDQRCSHPYMDGCFPVLGSIALQGLKLLCGASITIALIEIIGIYLSHSLAKSIRKIKSKRLQRDYEIRNQIINPSDGESVKNETNA